MKLGKNNKLIILICGLALGIRLISLNQSLWMDEAISATVVKNITLRGIITSFIYSDTHPPLYYLILRVWTLIFGYSEVSLRFPSVIFGLLTVFFVYKIGMVWNKKTGVYASLLIALSPLHIYYSQEARMYSLSTFLVTISSYFLLKKKWGYFSLSLLFLGLSDYLPLVILAPFGVYVFFFSKKKGERTRFLLSLIPLLIFLVIWFPVFKAQSVSTGHFLQKFPAWASVLGTASIKDAALVWVKFIIGRIGFNNNLVYIITVAIPSTIYLLLLFKGIKYFKKEGFLWMWLILPITITFVASFWIPGFSYFRLLFVLPAFILLIAGSLTKIRDNMMLLSLLVMISFIFSGVYLLNQNFWREDWKTLVPFVEAKMKRDEIVVVSYFEPFTPYLWYAKEKDKIYTFSNLPLEVNTSLYTLDYLMDLTDPNRSNYMKLTNLGFQQESVYNFRGVGQLRYWVSKK